MVRLTSRYAASLLQYAEEHGLVAEFYREILTLGVTHADQISPKLAEFLAVIPPEEKTAVLIRFAQLARERLQLLQVEIITAVPLTSEQLAAMEVKLIHIFRKQLEVTTRVDGSLLGGVRIIAGNTVIDDTIKRKLREMKRSAYKGVYFES